MNNLIKTIKAAKAIPGFRKFVPSLEEQLLDPRNFRQGRPLTRLSFDKDVSGGCGQMFQACFIKIID